MIRLRHRLGSLPVVAALAALLTASLPASAFYVAPSGTTGTVGDWSVWDDAPPNGHGGAVCRYGPKVNGYRTLKEIIVHPPVVKGAYSGLTRVGWRFKVFSHGPEGERWLYDKSMVYKDWASSTTAADDFTNISVMPSSWGVGYSVRIFIFFYKPGSNSNWQPPGGGRVRGSIEWWDIKYAGSIQYTDDLCWARVPPL